MIHHHIRLEMLGMMDSIFGEHIFQVIPIRHVCFGVLLTQYGSTLKEHDLVTVHSLIEGHQMAAPKQAPFSGLKTGPQTVRAHSAPSPLVAPIWAPKADPILGPNPEFPRSRMNRVD
jgi:hypothetical protein